MDDDDLCMMMALFWMQQQQMIMALLLQDSDDSSVESTIETGDDLESMATAQPQPPRPRPIPKVVAVRKKAQQVKPSRPCKASRPKAPSATMGEDKKRSK